MGIFNFFNVFLFGHKCMRCSKRVRRYFIVQVAETGAVRKFCEACLRDCLLLLVKPNQKEIDHAENLD
jgi:hypothetical protein